MSLADEVKNISPAEQEAMRRLAEQNARNITDRHEREQGARPNRPIPTQVTESGEMVMGKDGKLRGKRTGFDYDGKGSDGKTFAEVYGAREGEQRMDQPGAGVGGSFLIKP